MQWTEWRQVRRTRTAKDGPRRTLRAVLAALILLGAFLAACDDPSEPPDRDVVLRVTDDTVLASRQENLLEVRVDVTIENRSTSAIFVGQCGHTLQRLDAGSWTDVWRLACPRNVLHPARLAPGDETELALVIAARTDTLGAAWPGGDPTGDFRVVLDLLSSWNGIGTGDRLPLARRTSPRFPIREGVAPLP